MLYLVPTPIGNLEDITLRALRVLKEAALVLAEDTRTTGNLLRHHGITTRLAPHHQFNEHRSVQGIVERLRSGETIALVSDAGTPGISDAGFLLVRECLKNDVRVECLPGPTALIPALVGSGIPCDRFVFEGFLPHKKGRQTRMKQLAEEERTIVLYESPHRLVKCLEQLTTFFGPGRSACVARELTKIHEEFTRGTLAELIGHYSDKAVKGEIVLVVEGKKKGDQGPEEDLNISNEE
jgi:16S rRNA (cytidine1402-2'-O)-methyltransferase